MEGKKHKRGEQEWRFQEWFLEEVGTAQTEGTVNGEWEVVGRGLSLGKERQKGVGILK